MVRQKYKMHPYFALNAGNHVNDRKLCLAGGLAWAWLAMTATATTNDEHDPPEPLDVPPDASESAVPAEPPAVLRRFSPEQLEQLQQLKDWLAARRAARESATAGVSGAVRRVIPYTYTDPWTPKLSGQRVRELLTPLGQRYAAGFNSAPPAVRVGPGAGRPDPVETGGPPAETGSLVPPATADGASPRDRSGGDWIEQLRRPVSMSGRRIIRGSKELQDGRTTPRFDVEIPDRTD